MKNIKIILLALFIGIAAITASAQTKDSLSNPGATASESTTTAKVDETSGTQRYLWYGGAIGLIVVMIVIGVVRSRKKSNSALTSDDDEISNPASGVNPF